MTFTGIGGGGRSYTVEFEDEQNGEQLGRSLGRNIPEVGHHVLIDDKKFVVVAVEHQYRSHAAGNVKMPEKIVVRLRRGAGTGPS